MLSSRIRSMGAAHWLFLFGSILAGWIVLWLMAVPSDIRELGQIYGAEFWISLCLATPDITGYPSMFLMWALMSAAMMLPTALPAFATYDELGESTEISFGRLVLGYLSVWLGFAAVAAALQILLFQVGLLDGFGTSQSTVFSAVLLAIAGGYQFSPIKEACLSKCRMPLTFFMENWEQGALKMGFRLGAICLGCCWALMLLGFVGGVMSLGFMGLATVIMILEKMPTIGKYISAPLGFALLAASVLMLVTIFI
jgi:predicted metal-binding membrane protein